MILDKFPSPAEFYKTYWNKKPFMAQSAVDTSLFDALIDADTLGGLSLEEGVKSRIVVTAPEGNKWSCEHGPFEEDHFSTLGDKRWSLLVQNVEQYHTDTAKLLRAFNFAPRWLMDDIMVSYSNEGGTVGPHTDSYHVFLVQGTGKRQWKVAHAADEHANYVEGQDLKVLKNDFDGATVEVNMGDVIYIPPHYAHSGITTEEALTFSVGFLGPKMSEMLVEYGYYLEQVQDLHQNKRYSGEGLNEASTGFFIDSVVQKSIQDDLISAINSDNFSTWMAEYFSASSHDDTEGLEKREYIVSEKELLARLKNGENLYRPDYIKISITQSSNGTAIFAVYGTVIPTSPDHNDLITWLDHNNTLSIQDLSKCGDPEHLMDTIALLYNHNILFFEGEE